LHRGAIQKAFSPKALEEQIDRAVHDVLNTVTSSLKAKGTFIEMDMESLCKMITMDIFCATAWSDSDYL